MKINALPISGLMSYDKGEAHNNQVKVDEDNNNAHGFNDAFSLDDDDTY